MPWRMPAMPVAANQRPPWRGAGFASHPATRGLARLPLHGLFEDGAVGRVDGAGGGGDVLDAEHHERPRARVADGALAGGGDADAVRAT